MTACSLIGGKELLEEVEQVLLALEVKEDFLQFATSEGGLASGAGNYQEVVIFEDHE